MKFTPKGLSVVVLTQLIGCATVLAPSGSINEQVDYFLSRQEYTNALALVADLQEHPNPEVSNPQQLQNKVIDQARYYEQQIITAANNAVAKDDWRSALDLYNEALTHFPNSEKLQQGQKELLQRQEISLAKLRLDLLIADGESMHKQLLISERVAATDPKDWFARHALENKIEEADKIANDLAEYGRHALANGDLELAKRTLPLAVKLSSTPDIKIANARLQELLAEEEERTRAEQQRIDLEKQIKDEEQQKLAQKQVKKKQKQQVAIAVAQKQALGGQLLVDFKNACEQSNFEVALKLRKDLTRFNLNTPEFQSLSKKLDNSIAIHVQSLIEEGTQAYSRQQYDQAMKKWEEARVLDPENEQLEAHIERASRVLEKLKSLKQTKDDN
ncbi:MAG: hypothetical protein PHC94_05745 [Methylobacter sp.]|nr:hypothetical protein [Methylobacter sp.]